MELLFSPKDTGYPTTTAHVPSEKHYKQLYHDAISDPEQFWATIAKRLTWFTPWHTVTSSDYTQGVFQWFMGGTLNACYNCLDRHVIAGLGDKSALIWEGNNLDETTTYTYSQLLSEVERFANVLLAQGIQKGDRVCIYLQMIPELMIAVLACARIGAVHSVVFAAFSAKALSERINNGGCRLLITQDTAIRGTKTDIPMKKQADEACSYTPCIEATIVVKRTGNQIPFNEATDLWWHEAMQSVDPHCPAVSMEAEDPLFILFTSGSTGMPKGIVHSTGGYLVYASYTHEVIFDYQPNDIYWCTADIGWITGHSYLVYGPLSNGATTVMYEGTPTFPDAGRFWQIIAKHKINIMYTAPTVLRTLMKEGDQWATQHDRSSLRVLGSVGEPIKQAEWLWYYRVIGEQSCPIVDTWWQTETGGIMITPLPASTTLQPGAATHPFIGIMPVLIDDKGEEVIGNPAEGQLCLQPTWPGMARTIFGDHQRYVDTYFKPYPGYFFTGDGAVRDDKGHYWITGRTDDVLNVSGHRLGSAEIEGIIGCVSQVAEAAVVGYPHAIKGESIYAFVTLMANVVPSDIIYQAINDAIKNNLGPHAVPDHIQFTEDLPKTRSGKIMRRLLRQIAAGEHDQFGDTSTLSNPDIITRLVKGHNVI